MNKLVEISVRQPITVTVGVILAILAGLIAFSTVPVQMAPSVESVVVAVTTRWEAASPIEIETDIVEEQEARLGDVDNLISMTSISQAGQAQIRLEFATGTDIAAAMNEVVQKLDEVPSYPDGVLQPEVVGIDPESVDYIAWVGFSSSDPNFPPSLMKDFMERRLRPRFERIPGVAEVGIVGAREKEVHIYVDPVDLAARGITYQEFMTAIESSNANFSGGALEDGKRNFRIRSVGRFQDVEEIENLVIRRDESGEVRVRDVGEVSFAYKESDGWVRSRGFPMAFFNFQLAQGANLLETMDLMQQEFATLNAPGGLLEQEARRIGIDGTFQLSQSYNAAEYVNDALALVQNNIFLGGALAVITLLLFLRSLKTIGIIAMAIPISIIGSVVILVLMGRSVNIISLAGMAFAVGMVVDNAIVVIENIFRHLEMGKTAIRAALAGAREVAGAVLASTLTTILVFVPVLLIQDSAGQLFRDIALAIVAAVSLSLIVSLSVIPSAASVFFNTDKEKPEDLPVHKLPGRFASFIHRITSVISSAPRMVSRLVTWIIQTWPRRIAVASSFLVLTFAGIWALMPPIDYLPRGNRNLIIALLFPPPAYNLDKVSELGRRFEEIIAPAWLASEGPQYAIEERMFPDWDFEDNRPKLPVGDGSGKEIRPPPIENMFIGGFDGQIFLGVISAEKERIVDLQPLVNRAIYGPTAPDAVGFSFQVPLFRTGGTSGSAIQIDFAGADLDRVNASAASVFLRLMGEFGPQAVRAQPPNFLLPTPELQVFPDDERLQEMGMTRRDVGLAVQANSDGLILIDEFEIEGELKDLKILSPAAHNDVEAVEALLETPIATPAGDIVDLRAIADVTFVRGPDQIKHVDRLRAVTLEFTPPEGMPLESAIGQIESIIEQNRQSGAITPDIETDLAGSAGKLADIKEALLGDGTILGTLTSTLFLALFVVYLIMVVLFQSWSYPVVIMASVPLATFGGFLGLAIVHQWSLMDRYTPIQNLDVLTILGFVILAGVVVNNAILIVHQGLNFRNGTADEDGVREPLDPQTAILHSVESRVRPIMMSTLTSVGGMLPLVLMPGSGSELYRGLGSVVVGGLIVSTIFTLILVPTLLSMLFAVREPKVGERTDRVDSQGATGENDGSASEDSASFTTSGGDNSGGNGDRTSANKAGEPVNA